MMRDRFRTMASTVFLSLILILLVNLPDHPDAVSAGSFARLPLEWPAAFLLLLIGPAVTRRLAVWLIALLAVLILCLKLADLGTQAAFQRPFNPALDQQMIGDGWNVASGALGLPLALAALLAALIVLALAIVLLVAAGRSLAAAPPRHRARLAMLFLALALFAGLVRGFGLPLVEVRMPSYLAGRLALMVESSRDMRRFEAELARGIGPKTGRELFSAIRDKDVILIFVESYGRSALTDPRYRDRMARRLGAVDEEIRRAGLSAASAWATSPTVGGLSWLAHGTLLSGLWIDSQARYDRLVRSTQPSLNRLFAEAGWQSAAIMPAITLDWPESAYFGYRQVLAAKDLGYRGKPFNWVTMPDQYTLSAFERLSRAPAHAAGRRVMAELALISSHAPWTPVPSLVDWARIGDGTIFDNQAVQGPAPAVLWADPERVRAQYIATIDYSLETLGSYLARFGKDAVFVILGDHQPASIITGPGASRAVPIHIVSQDPALIAGFEAAGFTAGLQPAADGREWRMDVLRQLLIDRLSAGP